IKAQQGLKANIDYFKRKLEYLNLESYFIPSKSAIQCCGIQGNENVNKATQTLQAKGFDVRPIVSPTVPKGEERLRICLHTYNSGKQIEEALNLLQAIV
ncbi:MAG: 8-amino-7-oxononanoate synthase, partial [Maribacter sp.]|nr:8-amino-7-oxononanoate synthase [Maribacter sp.]